MVSLIIPQGGQISKISKLLSDEYGTASNIKSRVNRLSVLGALTSAQQRLKLYNTCPKNGLVVYCGTVITDEGKDRKVTIDFEPFRPIHTPLYHCDDKFYTYPLQELLARDDEAFGFIIMDGNGCLYSCVQGTNREIMHKFNVDLPKKHGRGGQSANRFANIRKEKRHNYVRKVAELATQLYIPNGQTPNVHGIVLAGSAGLKNQLKESNLFDPRLARIVIDTVDVSYGGLHGLNQAVELAKDTLGSVKLMKEKRLLQKYMKEIGQDTDKYCFMIEDTLKALEMGAVEDLIIWDQLDMDRIVLRNSSTNEETIMYLSNDELQETVSKDGKDSMLLEIIERESMVEWLANNYRGFGCNLKFVSDRSSEGTQFVKGFGGIGGILRWKINFTEMNNYGDTHTTRSNEDTDSEKSTVDCSQYCFDDGDFAF